MEVRRYDRSYDDAVYRLWSGSGVKQGFVPLQRDEFDRLLLENIHFSSDYAFLLIKEACVCGFICGCGEEERPETKDLGLFSCLLLEEGYDTGVGKCVSKKREKEDRKQLYESDQAAVDPAGNKRAPA